MARTDCTSPGTACRISRCSFAEWDEAEDPIARAGTKRFVSRPHSKQGVFQVLA